MTPDTPPPPSADNPALEAKLGALVASAPGLQQAEGQLGGGSSPSDVARAVELIKQRRTVARAMDILAEELPEVRTPRTEKGRRRGVGSRQGGAGRGSAVGYAAAGAGPGRRGHSFNRTAAAAPVAVSTMGLLGVRGHGRRAGPRHGHELP